jgi:DNA topoisomerase-3
LYEQVKDLDIASPELTGNWEKTLKDIELGETLKSTFDAEIIQYTGHLLGQLKELDVDFAQDGLKCPKCNKGAITENKKAFGCNRWKQGCDFVIWKEQSGKSLTMAVATEIVEKGESKLIKGFKNKEGKSFDAFLTLSPEFKVRKRFPSLEDKVLGECPKCKKAQIVAGKKAYGCMGYKEGCDFKVYLENFGKKLTESQLKTLISGKKTNKLKGFKTPSGKEFEAFLALDQDFKLKFQKP